MNTFFKTLFFFISFSPSINATEITHHSEIKTKLQASKRPSKRKINCAIRNGNDLYYMYVLREQLLVVGGTEEVEEESWVPLNYVPKKHDFEAIACGGPLTKTLYFRYLVTNLFVGLLLSLWRWGWGGILWQSPNEKSFCGFFNFSATPHS